MISSAMPAVGSRVRVNVGGREMLAAVIEWRGRLGVGNRAIVRVRTIDGREMEVPVAELCARGDVKDHPAALRLLAEAALNGVSSTLSENMASAYAWGHLKLLDASGTSLRLHWKPICSEVQKAIADAVGELGVHVREDFAQTVINEVAPRLADDDKLFRFLGERMVELMSDGDAVAWAVLFKNGFQQI